VTPRALLLRPQARAELLEAHAWYEQERPGLGQAFFQEVRTAVAVVREMPEAFPVVHLSVRRVLLKRFPYALYYSLEDGAVVLVAIVHGRRDPAVWQRP